MSKEALMNVYDSLLGENSIIIKLREGKGLDEEQYAFLLQSVKILIDHYKNKDCIPKKLALCFLDISNGFYFREGWYKKAQAVRNEEAGQELAYYAGQLFFAGQKEEIGEKEEAPFLNYVYRCLSGKDSILLRMDEGIEPDWNQLHKLIQSMKELAEYYKDKELVPKQLARCFLEIYNHFYFHTDRFTEEQAERLEDAVHEISFYAEQLFGTDAEQLFLFSSFYDKIAVITACFQAV